MVTLCSAVIKHAAGPLLHGLRIASYSKVGHRLGSRSSGVGGRAGGPNCVPDEQPWHHFAASSPGSARSPACGCHAEKPAYSDQADPVSRPRSPENPAHRRCSDARYQRAASARPARPTHLRCACPPARGTSRASDLAAPCHSRLPQDVAVQGGAWGSRARWSIHPRTSLSATRA